MQIGNVGSINTLTNTETVNNYNSGVIKEAQTAVIPQDVPEDQTRALRQIQDELVKDAPNTALIKQLLINMKKMSPQLLQIAFNIFKNPLVALSLSYELFTKDNE